MKSKYVIIVGDICPDWGFKSQFATGNPENVFHNTLPLLLNSDFVIANLESPLTSSEKKLNKNSVCLKGNPSDAEVLKKAGIKAVSLANNHILDYGTEGLRDTLSVLNKNGISYYGIEGKKNISNPFVFVVNGKKIGIVSFAEREFNCAADYGTGACCWDDLVSPKIVASAKKQCDFLIVQYHGGIEHYIYPSPYLQKKCRTMAEMGADLITCQHSHCIGTRENWNGTEILYGQGNSIFGYREKNESWNKGLLIKLSIDDVFSIDYIPIIATKDGEFLLERIETDETMRSFNTESNKITDSEFVRNEWNKFCSKRTFEYLPLAFCKGRVFNKLNRIFKGNLIKLFTRKKDRRNVMNLLRCDAHREVLTTIFENEHYAKKK